jgi:hypothetical protein
MLEPIFELTSSQLDISSLYLDPNNPRFAEDGRPYVSDEEIDQEARQDELMSKLEQEYGVDRLKDNMEVNGYLPIDRIVVRRFKPDKFVVLEGNRRITAAKRLLRSHEEDKRELDPRVVNTLKSIPVLIYVGSDTNAAWVFQGIRHISGPKDWSAYNKAKLLVDQMEKQGLNLTDAGKIFGVSAYGAGQWVRGYYTFLQAKEHPDYHRDIDTRVFPILQELFGRSNISLKDWMEWDDKEEMFTNSERFSEFLSWLYPKLNDNGDFDPDLPGDWERRRISTALDLRLLSQLVSSHPEEFSAFRNGAANLSTAYGRAVSKQEELQEGADDYLRKIGNFRVELEQLPIMKVLSEDKTASLLESLDKLLPLIQNIKNVLTK